MKKSLILVLLCMFLLVGCQSNEHGLSKKNPTQVTIWNYYNGAQAIAFDKLVTEFNATEGQEKGIVVVSESKGSIDDLVSAIQDSIDGKAGAEKLPNMFQCYLDVAVGWDEKDIFVNLDDYVSKDLKAEYIENYVKEGSFGKNNEWKLFPFAKSTEVLMLNKTDWEPFAKEYGYTEDDLKTWESIAKVSEDYYKWSNGKSFFGRDSFANYMIVGSKQLGKEIFKVDSGKATLQFDEEIMRRLWDNYYVPFVKGYYGQEGRYRSDDIKLGKILAMICSSSSTAYTPSEVTVDGKTHNIDSVVLPLPNFEGTDAYAVQQGANIGVVKSDETKEYASVVFLEWLTQTEQNLEFCVATGYLPAKKEANTTKTYNDYVTKNKVEVEALQNDTFNTALSQIESGTMYKEGGFSGEYDARNILNTSMIELAQKDRKAVLNAVKKGKKEEEVLKAYLTDEHFKEWYEDTKKQLEGYCK